MATEKQGKIVEKPRKNSGPNVPAAALMCGQRKVSSHTHTHSHTHKHTHTNSLTLKL